MKIKNKTGTLESFKPPSCAVLSGKKYALNTDFRVWIEIEKLLTANVGESERRARLAAALAMAYPKLPKNASEAINGMLWFYSAGKNDARISEKPREKSKKRYKAVYDFEADFEYLWGAFLSEYGIDLSRDELHWWKFRALLMSLSDECRFSKILAYRCTDTSEIENKEVRRFYEKMKKRFRLPDVRTAEERERETAECLAELM